MSETAPKSQPDQTLASSIDGVDIERLSLDMRAIAEAIELLGYTTANSIGTPTIPERIRSTSGGIGILEKEGVKSTKQRRILKDKEVIESRRYLGTVWTGNKLRDADPENWLLEVDGDEAVLQEMAKLAGALGGTFGAKVRVAQRSLENKYENSGDYSI